MSQLIALRRHIKSVKTTKKITYAMRLISMSLYSKLEKLNKPLAHHQQQILEIFADVLAHVPEWDNPILFPKDLFNTTPLYVVAASSKGLCGSFNSNLFRLFHHSYLAEEHQTPKFITIGSKAHKFIREQNAGDILYNFDEFNSKNFITIAETITSLILEADPPLSSVTFFSTRFRSFFSQKPKKSPLIPLSKEALAKIRAERLKIDGDERPNQDTPEPIWETPVHETLSYLTGAYIKSTILNLLYSSLLSEQASRFIAMDTATSNADNFLEKLTLEYNKSRQALITKEVSELAASLG